MTASNLTLIIMMFLAIIMMLFMAYHSVKIIPPGKAGIRERLGRYLTTEDQGLVLLLPFMEKLQMLDLKEHNVLYKLKSIRTKDNVLLDIDIEHLYRISDPKKAFYESANLEEAIRVTCLQLLRNIINEIEYDNVHNSNKETEIKLVESLNKELALYGILVTRLVLKEIKHQ